MAAPRRFDHDEARRLRAEGMTYVAIAALMGVTDRTVRLICDPVQRAKSVARNTAWQRSARCPDCGAQTTRHYVGGDHRCRVCDSLRQATSVRPNALRCFACHEWKPDEGFPKNRGGRVSRRGRHNFCRVCSTRVRQEYRERHKVPCVGCGVHVLPPSEKRTNGTDVPRCSRCARLEVLRRQRERAAA